MTTQSTMGDKEFLTDCIASQKQAASSHNTFAGECVNEQLRNEFLSILKDEHCIQSELFNDANSRGWYPVKQAPGNEITMVRDKYKGGCGCQ
ncbi:MAG: spore coat protein [Oscillospiraceae bacterium]|nr:spore coat protein [Oscillospiraceae bacterium]